MFTGSLDAVPAATAVALIGILVTAALFLWALQRIFLGTPDAGLSARLVDAADVRGTEAVAIVPLLGLALVIGILPRFLLDVIEPAARTVVGLVAR